LQPVDLLRLIMVERHQVEMHSILDHLGISDGHENESGPALLGRARQSERAAGHVHLLEPVPGDGTPELCYDASVATIERDVEDG
jgi:hypothetical protein